MTVIDFVRDQLRQAHEFLEMTMSDVTPEQAAAALGWVLGAGVVGHVRTHSGEICCLEGIQGV